MSDTWHQRVREVFLAVLEFPSGEREAATRTLCGGDAALEKEVLSLLAFSGDEGPAGDQPAPSTEPPRLLAGTLFAQRYRIIECLGRGGMGEVFRAQDTVLDVPVALKLIRIPDETSRQQLLKEVRLARGVNHPAICRVFDVGADGEELFLTMEYVAGEDLGVLLRRIQRLTPEKVIDIGRQLCAGLAAAHARGIYHLDLKPSNILIDQQGRVRITDFGVATTRQEAARRDIIGTPGYMAPEQYIPGVTLTERTDLFALGLVLYELLTGKNAFPATGSPRKFLRQRPISPSQLADGVPPGLENIILQALDPDPARRPSSALAFSAGLPGTDPLALAEQAGLTLPADLVPRAETRDQFGSRTRVALTIALVAGLWLCVEGNDHKGRLSRQAPPSRPETLVQRAREWAKGYGYPVRTKTGEFGYFNDPSSPPGNPRVLFWYRELGLPQSTSFEKKVLLPGSGLQAELRERGGWLAFLDPGERLVFFRWHPRADFNNKKLSPEGGPDWPTLLAPTGFDPAGLRSIEPEVTVEFSTSSAAWSGTDSRKLPVRIDSAALGQRLVSLSVTPEVGSSPAKQEDPSETSPAGSLILALLALIVVQALAIGLAWGNFRRKQVDLSSAGRLVWILGAIGLLRLAFAPATHPLSFQPLPFLLGALGLMVLIFLTGTGYLALEPLVRREWPRTLVAWSRALRGRWTDPAVGTSMIVGVIAGVFGALATILLLKNPADLPLLSPLPSVAERLGAALSRGATASAVFLQARHAITTGILQLLVLSLLQMVFRRRWVSIPLFIAFDPLLMCLMFPGNPILLGIALVSAGIRGLVLVRFGLLAFVAALFSQGILQLLPLSDRSEAWYAGAGYFGVGMLLILGLFGLAVSARRRTVGE